MSSPRFKTYTAPFQFTEDETRRRAREFRDELRLRRTVRDFSDRDVPPDVVEHCIEAAGTAPSGANKQPWHFVVVNDPETRTRMREAVEKEEYDFYTRRAPREWIEALKPIGTDYRKPFIETAPVLIAIFAQNFEQHEDGSRSKNYYVQESVGIATGMLITALHHAGLATLTHTPSPMGFINEILGRAKHERTYMLIVAGYAARDARVPVIEKKKTSEIMTYV